MAKASTTIKSCQTVLRTGDGRIQLRRACDIYLTLLRGADSVCIAEDPALIGRIQGVAAALKGLLFGGVFRRHVVHTVA